MINGVVASIILHSSALLAVRDLNSRTLHSVNRKTNRTTQHIQTLKRCSSFSHIWTRNLHVNKPFTNWAWLKPELHPLMKGKKFTTPSGKQIAWYVSCKEYQWYTLRRINIVKLLSMLLWTLKLSKLKLHEPDGVRIWSSY